MAADERRDPQAPPRLHRDRPAAGRRARLRVRDRPEPAPADPAARGEALRAQGRVPDRPGRRPGPGADAARRRASRSATSRTSRSRTASPSSPSASIATSCRSTRTRRSCCDPRPASRTCSSRWTPGSERPARSMRGHGPARQHRARRQPRRGPRRARLRHPGVPAAAARQRRAGRSTGGRRTSVDVLGSLGPLTKDLDRINSKVAERKDNLRRLITNFNLLTREVGAQRAEPHRPRRGLEHDDRGDRRAGPERPARDPAPAGNPAAVDGCAQPHRRSSPTSSARRSTICGRSRATSTRSTPRPGSWRCRRPR